MTGMEYYSCKQSEVIHISLPSYHFEKLNNPQTTGEKCKNEKIKNSLLFTLPLSLKEVKLSNPRQLIANTKAEKKNLLIK